MSFNILSFLQAFLGGLDVPDIELKAVEWLETKGQQYPDLEERTKELAEFLKTTIAEAHPALDPAAMANTLKGIAADVVNGNAGIDREAGGGAG